MLDALNRALDSAYSTAEALSTPQKAIANSGTFYAADAYGYGNLGYASSREQSIAREEYRHYKGDPYSVIRVIASRMSGQNVVVARIGKPKAKSRSLKAYIERGAIRNEQFDQRVLKRFAPEDVEIVPDHPLLDVLEDPNELMVESTLWLVSVANIFLTGRCLWVIDPDPKRPEIMPIPSTWATPIHDVAAGKLYARWSVKPPNGIGDPVEIPGDFVANFYFPDPQDPFGCVSLIGVQADAILAAEDIAISQRVAFRNEINPATAIIVGDAAAQDGKRQMRLSPEQRRQIITWLRQEYAGARKMGLPIILDSMIKDVKELGSKPKEVGFLESQDATTKKIFTAGGVPLSSAGVTEGANYGSSGVADHTLIVNSVGPLCKLFSEGITAWVLPHFDETAKRHKTRAWIVPPEAYDPDLNIRRWANGRQLGCYTRNEYRVKVLGLPPIDGWDDVLVQAAMRSVPAGEPVEIATAQTGAPLPAGQGSIVNGPPGDAADPENMRRALTPSELEERKSYRATFTKAAKDLWKKAQDNAFKDLAPTMTNYFVGQTRSIVIGLRSLPDQNASAHGDVAGSLFLPSQWTAKLHDTLAPQVEKQMHTGASLTMTLGQKSACFYRKDPALTTLPPKVQDAIQFSIDNALSHLVDSGIWHDINETTKRDLSFSIQEGLQAGDTIKELANRIEKNMGPQWAGNRAMKVARTESGRALNAGHYAAQQELESEGIAYGQEWLSIIDQFTRPDHVEMNGQKVGPGEMFDVAGTPAPYPLWEGLPAEQVVFCRCIAVPVTDPFQTSYQPVGGRLAGYFQKGHAKNGHAHSSCS